MAKHDHAQANGASAPAPAPDTRDEEIARLRARLDALVQERDAANREAGLLRAQLDANAEAAPSVPTEEPGVTGDKLAANVVEALAVIATKAIESEQHERVSAHALVQVEKLLRILVQQNERAYHVATASGADV